MKEKRGGFGEVVGGIAQGIAGAARRRAHEREPRVLLYDAAGLPQVLPHGAPARDALVTTAGKLIELAGGVPGADDEDTDPDLEDAAQ